MLQRSLASMQNKSRLAFVDNGWLELFVLADNLCLKYIITISIFPLRFQYITGNISGWDLHELLVRYEKHDEDEVKNIFYMNWYS